MIWTLQENAGHLFGPFEDAGQPNQQVIMRALAAQHKPIHQQRRDPNLARYYYLLGEDHRVSLCSIGTNLYDWHAGAWFIVGTRQIIGEFLNNGVYAGNAHLVGQKGLQLTMRRLEKLEGQPDIQFETVNQMLEAISYQILDLARAEQIQAETERKYRWQ